MAVVELTLELPVPNEADIEASLGGSRWSVTECGWPTDLPAESISLLASPVLVSAAPHGRIRRLRRHI